MTTMMHTLQRWQDQYLELMDRWEQPVVRFTGRAAASVAAYVPERPDWAFLAEVPGLTEVVDNQLKFRRRVVDHQAAFVRTMMRSMQPVLVRLEPKPSAAKAAVTEARPTRARAPKARATRTPAGHAVRMHAA